MILFNHRDMRRQRSWYIAQIITGIVIGYLMPENTYANNSEYSMKADQLILDNGLQSVWGQDSSQPIVAIEARIRGGLRGEGEFVGTGVTHFIEHMLFKGTPTRPAGTIEQEVRRYGGTINAFTSFDSTGVTLFVESKFLKEALEMLADILQNALFDQTEFDKERAVVISEIQMNQDDPDRRIHQLFWSRHQLQHPYRHPILGYQPLLEKLTVADMESFYKQQYKPQNIVISCVGDLDKTAFPDLIKEIFSDWPRGKEDMRQYLVPVDPPKASTQQVSESLPVQTTYVMMGFSSVSLSHPDLYALDVLASILGQGRSSRLHETIVRQEQLAHSAQSWNYTPYDPGAFVIYFKADPDKAQMAQVRIKELLDDVKLKGVSKQEVDKAKAQVSASYLFGLQSVEEKASDLANSLLYTGDPLFSRQYVSRINAITRDQIQDVANRYFNFDKMTIAKIEPADKVLSSKDAPSKTSKPLQLTKKTLSNGITVLIGADSTLPIAGMGIVYRGGVRVEDQDHQGISGFTSSLLIKGTKKRSALEIASTVESWGGSLSPFSGRDEFGLSLQLLSRDVDRGIELLHELVTLSTFPKEEVEIQRQLAFNRLASQEDEIFNVSARLLRETLFENHPYGLDPLGTKDTIAAFTREDCIAFAKKWMTPSNAVITVFGDVDPTQVVQKLEKTFGTIQSGESPWPESLDVSYPQSIRSEFKHLQREQAVIMLGFKGATYVDEQRHATDVMTAVLSGMAGRLFQTVREKYGLAYTLGAVNSSGWDPGYLLVYAATKPEEQSKVIEILEEQLKLAADEGFTEDEITQAKRYLIGLHRTDLQNIVGLARRSALDELHGLGYDAWKHEENNINAVTPAAAHEAAKRFLTIEKRAQVIVSPSEYPSKQAIPVH